LKASFQKIISFILLFSSVLFISSSLPQEKLLPRKVIFGNPDKENLCISPDHQMISFLAPVDNVLNLCVAPTDKPEDAVIITKDTLSGIRTYFWAYNNSHIIYTQDLGGDENWQVHAVNVSTGEDITLTPFEEITGPDGKPVTLADGTKLRPRADIQHVSYKYPDEILISMNNRNPYYSDIYRLNIVNGDLRMIQQNDDFQSFLTDDNYNVRYAIKNSPDGGNEYYESDGKGGWTLFDKIPMEDMMTTWPISFDKTGRILYMADSRGRNTSALVSIDLETGNKNVIHEDPHADIIKLLIHPTEKTIEAAASEYLRTEWKILDYSFEPDFNYLKTVSAGDLNIASRSLDGNFWTVSFVKDDGPANYYIYDRQNKEAKFIFTNKNNLENVKLSKMHPVEIKSRDGLTLVSYLTLPYWSDPDNDGRPDSPLPMVLLVHGGPWDRDSWGYNYYHQWISSRGYAVLSVNFRGSTGFGKSFINAGNKEWSRKMHNDLLDAVDWAVNEKITEKDKVAIMGRSYGGYATLVALTFTPDEFVCGVDIYGPSNLQTLLESTPSYWEPMINTLATRVGDFRTEEGKKHLKECSPITYVDKISKPLLIGQGANDARVKQSEADQIVKAMQEKNIPVTYVLYSDEGHGFVRPENRMSFYAVVEIFLAQILGGKSEPIGDDFKNSTIQVPAGSEYIQTLTEKLNGN
jgi:dipeptidyl aminopeptidase/acylaminoacyl peptidase